VSIRRARVSYPALRTMLMLKHASAHDVQVAEYPTGIWVKPHN